MAVIENDSPIYREFHVTRPVFGPCLNAHEREYGIQYADSHGGLLPQDSFWRYLEVKHAINPLRFDHHHPHIAPYLDRDEQLRLAMSRGEAAAGQGHPTTPATGHSPAAGHSKPGSGGQVTKSPPLTETLAPVTVHELPPAPNTGVPVTVTGTPITAAVPEPSAPALVGVALLAAAGLRYLRARRG